MKELKVRIVRGTHRYEKSAFLLGEPLVEELGKKGIRAELYTVPAYAADTNRESPDTYKTNAKARSHWWRGISKEAMHIFSLHSYPYGRPEVITQYPGYEEIGKYGTPGNEASVFLFRRIDLKEQFLKNPIHRIRWLTDLRKRNTSIYEDSTLVYSSILEVPAVPDQSDPRGLQVDMERTLSLFDAKILVEMLSEGIVKQIKKS